jgi:cytochrome c oxidase subunit II
LSPSSRAGSGLLAPGLVDTRHEYNHLFAIYVPIAIGVFAAIVLVVAFAMIRYRRRAPAQAARWHEHNPIEGTYAVLLALVVAFLLYLTFTAEHRVDTVANRERPGLTIDVTAAKWEWTFFYRRHGITVRSGTVGRQPLVVPAGVPIRFNLTSADVIHAFWIPHIRYKHDVIPGSTQVATLTFGKPGLFQGSCAEFCGLRHSDMLFAVRVVSPSAFRSWLSGGGRGPAR